MNLLLPLTLVASLLPSQWVHPFHLPQPDAGSGEVWMVVEIPMGSIHKFEIDKQTGHVVVDRTMSMPVAYPANYGTIASTHAEDGDNLDALVYTREALPPGVLIKVRAIGMLPMLDGGEQDHKLIVVPVSKVDPHYDNITDISDLPAIERERISAFFRVYKQLPEGRKKVELEALQGREAAALTLNTALRAYADRAKSAAAEAVR
jgi:inorganic pyrophosphatase